jgi:outer membrane lipoprotein-sorting protein
MNRVAWVFAACVSVVLPAWAQEAKPAAPALPADVKAVLDKVDQTVYNAKGAGLNDLSFSMVIPMFAQMGVTDPIKIYWKKPDLSKVEVPDALAQFMGGQEAVSKQMGKNAQRLAGDAYSSRLEGYSTKLEKDGDLQKIVATTNDKDKDASEITLWVDSNNLVVKMSQKLTQANAMGIGEVEQSIKYEKKGDRYVPQEMQSPQAGTTKFEYEQVNGFWFPKKVTQQPPGNPNPVEIEFKDVKVNSGLDDAFFKKSDKAPASGEKQEKKG